MATINKLNRVRETKEALKTVLNEHGGSVTEETVFREYPVIAQRLLESGGGGGGSAVLQEKTITENGVYTPDEGYGGFSKVAVNVESGASGDLPTLFTPTISYTASTGKLSITDGGNGSFSVKYALYADDIYQGETTEKTINIADYFEQPTETKPTVIKVCAKAENFNNSAFSNMAVWNYVAVSEGTAGLLYTLSSDGTYYYCTGLGTAQTTDVEVASEIDGIPVRYIKEFENSDVTSIVIPKSVTGLLYRAFRNSKLTSIVIPNSVTSLGTRENASATSTSGYVFYGCAKLTSVSFEEPCQIKSFGDLYRVGIFYGCNSLVSLYVPSSVTFIGEQCFYNCNALKRLDFSNHTAVPAMVNKNALQSTPSTLQIKVPASLIDEWKTATNWSTYASKIVTEFTNEV